MKPLSAVFAFAFVLGSVALLTHCGGVQTRSVSAADIAALPAGQSLEVDLTRSGTVYRFDDASLDYARVHVRTGTGVMPLAEKVKQTGVGRGGLLLGRPEDMRDHLPPLTGDTTTNYDCGVFCKCDDTTDCIDLILSGKCSDDFWCSSQTSACFCTAKA